MLQVGFVSVDLFELLEIEVVAHDLALEHGHEHTLVLGVCHPRLEELVAEGLNLGQHVFLVVFEQSGHVLVPCFL